VGGFVSAGLELAEQVEPLAPAASAALSERRHLAGLWRAASGLATRRRARDGHPAAGARSLAAQARLGPASLPRSRVPLPPSAE
jgi:hypothetical protein